MSKRIGKAWHAQVHHHDLDILRAQRLHDLVAVVGHRDGHSPASKRSGQRRRVLDFVIREQHPNRCGHVRDAVVG